MEGEGGKSEPPANTLGEEEEKGTQTEGSLAKASVYHKAKCGKLVFTNSRGGNQYLGKIQEQLKPLLALNVFTP